MLTEVAKNIYKKAVPLSNNPLREINAYIITGEKNLLIDTGFNRIECEEALKSAFTELGIDTIDVFITYLHCCLKVWMLLVFVERERTWTLLLAAADTLRKF